MEPENNKKNKQDTFIYNYDEYADAIFRYCLYRVFDRERARELMQETFTRTWEYLEKGKEIENMRAFLYKVAHNLCVNEFARSKAYSLDNMMDTVNFNPADEKASSLEKEVEIKLLLEKMNLLKPEEKELLIMRYVDDLAVKEIAELLGVLPNTVSVRIRRSEDSLRKLMTDNEIK